MSPSLQGIAEEQGQMVLQAAPAARLGRIMNHAATELWDISNYQDAQEMWEEGCAIARRILAAGPGA
jgi:Flp pilus assembly CpaE family ATPase